VDTQIGQYAVIREEKKRRFILPKDRDPDYVPVSRERAKTSAGQVMVLRCGKVTFKFCLCHTLNSASWHAVYGPAFAMYTYCFNNQVDFIMGDGNQHYQFCSKAHKTKSNQEDPKAIRKIACSISCSVILSAKSTQESTLHSDSTTS
jgi:hypothetical protein